MKFRLAFLALLLLAGTPVLMGQAVPTATSTMSPTIGPNLPSLDGQIHYALSASEVIQYGYYGAGSTTASTSFSGDIGYTSKSVARPTSLVLAGGVFLPNEGGQGTTGYVSASGTQGYLTRHWAFYITDSFTFLPQSPTTGLAGIPGVGDLGLTPVDITGEGPLGGILTDFGDRIANTVSGSAERQLGARTSVSGSASYSVLHFLNGAVVDALDNDQYSGTVSLNQKIDQRSSASIFANYSAYVYPGNVENSTNPSFYSKSLGVSYQRVLSRTLSVYGSIGPQWVSSSNSLLIPSRLGVIASAGLSYQHRQTTAGVGYTHGVNGGSGIIPGATSDTLFANIGRNFGRNWASSATIGYAHSSGLSEFAVGDSAVLTHSVFDSLYGGVQVNRRITSSFSAYASYTVQNQSQNNFFNTTNAFSGTSQTIGIGITYAPRSTRLGQF